MISSSEENTTLNFPTPSEITQETDLLKQEWVALSDSFESACQIIARLSTFLQDSDPKKATWLSEQKSFPDFPIEADITLRCGNNPDYQANNAKLEDSCLQLFQTFRALKQNYQTCATDTGELSLFKESMPESTHESAPKSTPIQNFYYTLSDFSHALLDTAQILEARQTLILQITGTKGIPSALDPAKLQIFGQNLLELADSFVPISPTTPEKQPDQISPSAFLYASVCNFYDAWKNFDYPALEDWTGDKLSTSLSRAEDAFGFCNKKASNEWGSAFIRTSSQILHTQTQQPSEQLSGQLDREAELRQAYWQTLNQAKAAYKTAKDCDKAFYASLHNEAIDTLEVLATLAANGSIKPLTFTDKLGDLRPAQFLATVNSANLQAFLEEAQTSLQTQFPAVANLIPQTTAKLLAELGQSHVALTELQQRLEDYKISFFRYLFFLSSEHIDVLEQIINDNPQLVTRTTHTFFGGQTATKFSALLPASP